MKITSETQSRTLLIGGVIAALIVGVVGGYFAAHLGMADMPGMQGKSMKDMPMKEGDMKSMPTSPPGTIFIPAATRQLIGVRTAPVSYAPLAQEIRAVGTVQYDARNLTKVNLSVAGWIDQVQIIPVVKSLPQGQ